MAHFDSLPPDVLRRLKQSRGIDPEEALTEWLAVIRDGSFDTRRLVAAIHGWERIPVPVVIPLAVVLPAQKSSRAEKA